MTIDRFPAPFGRYTLLERIAQGGMAEVFRASLQTDSGIEKILCIKRMHPQFSSNSEYVSLFINETRIATSLVHGNVIQVFDAGRHDDCFFLVMEFLDGPDLAHVLERVSKMGTQISLGATLWIGCEVLRALEYIHNYRDAQGQARPVIHCDLSPHNILLSFDGVAKVTDFGVAMVQGQQASATRRRAKPDYISPEIARGEAVDARSDLFSLGVVLYEMLSGTRPFESTSDAETVRRIQTVDRLDVERLDAPEELRRILDRALRGDPTRRYRSSSAFHADMIATLIRLVPDYCSTTFAKELRGLFPWEVQNLRSGTRTRDRLANQMSEAGMFVTQNDGSTEDLLKLRTVSLPYLPALKQQTNGPPQEEPRSTSSRSLVFAALIVATCGLLWWLMYYYS